MFFGLEQEGAGDENHIAPPEIVLAEVPLNGEEQLFDRGVYEFLLEDELEAIEE
jgi:hypothetical protein